MENVSTPPKKKSPVIYIIIVAVILAAFFGIRSFLHNRHYEGTDNAQIESRAVPVIARVAGYVDSLGVDDYQTVKQGDALIIIDSKEYSIAVTQAKADLMNAEADMANAEAAYRNSLANKKVAMANASVQQVRVEKANADLARDEALFKDEAITKKQVEDTRSNAQTTIKQYSANEEQVNLASTQVATGEAQLQKAKAQIEIRKAALEQAQLRLSYCKVVAPVTGRIGKRNIEKGQYIQPGTPLFAIVNDENFWLVANFKETQLEKMKEGQEVDIVLDGYPDVNIKGKVGAFSQATGAKFSLLPPDNATGNFVKVTQRIPVKIDLINVQQYKNILRAGLSADVEVKVD
jgi:membrane fusion protein (multidrug efflux system)